MKVIALGDAVLGEGIPKICVPVVGKDRKEVLKAAERAADSCADIIELRADSLREEPCRGYFSELLPEIRTRIGGKSLLFTWRTVEEGGFCPERDVFYGEYAIEAAGSGAADFIDIEIRASGAGELISEARANGVFVIASEHHFSHTPDNGAMERALSRMAARGADIAKLAVMPRTEEDVNRLLAVSEKMKDLLPIPIITISMGVLGERSRVCGEKSGSCITFGTAGKASAPGQIGCERLRELLLDFHSRLGYNT